MGSGSDKKWLVYGANGYTGELIVREAVNKGLKPVIAGRNPEKIRALASELGLQSVVFDLDDQVKVARILKNYDLVLNCAGPFVRTCEVMALAAINASCHYLDITGEISVFEYLQHCDAKAKFNDVMLLPGVGFDVVPTDCMAMHLKKRLPDACSLELAFMGPNKAAAGSIKTALQQLPYGSKIRKDGEVITVPHFSSERNLKIENKNYTIYPIPWGDVFTAYYSTQIPNITVYTSFAKEQVFSLKMARPLTLALKNRAILEVAERIVDKVVPEPGEDYRDWARCYIWGEVKNKAGKKVSAVIKTKDTYSFTVESSLLIIQKVLQGKVAYGFQTPSLVFGEELVHEVAGTEKIS